MGFTVVSNLIGREHQDAAINTSHGQSHSTPHLLTHPSTSRTPKLLVFR